MTKLCIIGAGSAVFTKTIVTDIFLMDEFKNIQISLMDINEKRLKISENIVKPRNNTTLATIVNENDIAILFVKLRAFLPTFLPTRPAFCE